jgi:hypothetical protein
MLNEPRSEATSEPNWPALLPVARELQAWVNALPVWSEWSQETWSAFKRRHGQAEQELTERLRRMPGCTIARSPNGSTTTLTLAGVEARGPGRLEVACRNWIAQVQKAAHAATRPPS